MSCPGARGKAAATPPPPSAAQDDSDDSEYAPDAHDASEEEVSVVDSDAERDSDSDAFQPGQSNRATSAAPKKRKSPAAKPKATKAQKTRRADAESELVTLEDLDKRLGHEAEEERDPPDTMLMPLLPFQKQWLAWSVKQENSVIKGGILADEMGMGKTIQAISLILDNHKDHKQNVSDLKAKGKVGSKGKGGGTLGGAPLPLKATVVICPVVAIIQWRAEIARFTHSGSLKVMLYHGPKRNLDVAELQEADVVLTTYNVIEAEYRKNVLPNKKACPYCNKKYYPQQLKMHLTFWCGPNAQKSEAQSKTQSKKRPGSGGDTKSKSQGSAGPKSKTKTKPPPKGKAKGKAKGKKDEDSDWEDEASSENESEQEVEEEEEVEEVKEIPKPKGKGKAKGGAKGSKGANNENSNQNNNQNGRLGWVKAYFKALKEGPDEEEELAEDEQQQAAPDFSKSILHRFHWHRIILDEAHSIKDRRSNTAKAVFALSSTYKWALSGTPLQNRVGELYSQIRFLQIQPYSYYFCKAKGCDCKCLDYSFGKDWRKCDFCGHSPLQHFCWWNRMVANPIKYHGYSGRGHDAMLILKNEVLAKTLLRRTKQECADSLALPPRKMSLRKLEFDSREEDFYQALYTQSQSQFDTYVKSGTVVNNYAHIFDLLIRLRQAVNHPYLVVHSASAGMRAAAEAVAQAGGSAEYEKQPDAQDQEAVCGICHDPVEDPVTTACKHTFCRVCVMEYIASATDRAKCPTCAKLLTVDFTQSSDSLEKTATITAARRPKKSSILSRIDLSNFQTSTKIEALREEIYHARARNPSAKVLVFSQFTSMLQLMLHRLEATGLKCVMLEGSMTLEQRDTIITQFTTDPAVNVFLMSLKAGGVALNLTAATHVMLMDPWWNPAVEQQAQDRIHRLGQFRPIRVTRFVIRTSIEERILKLQEKKQLVFEGTVGQNTEALGKLTEEDMRFLFS